MSACTSNVAEVKEAVKVAKNEKRMFGRSVSVIATYGSLKAP